MRMIYSGLLIILREKYTDGQIRNLLTRHEGEWHRTAPKDDCPVCAFWTPEHVEAFDVTRVVEI